MLATTKDKMFLVFKKKENGFCILHSITARKPHYILMCFTFWTPIFLFRFFCLF